MTAGRGSNGDGTGAVLTLEPSRAGRDATVTLTDHVEDVQLAVELEDAAGSPERIEAADRFPAPVDGCWRLTAAGVIPLCTADVYVRTPGNDVVATAGAGDPAEVPAGPHVLELSTAPVKTYLALEGPALVYFDGRYPKLAFEGTPDEVVLAARSHHETPAGTVTVTDSAADVATALSTFGSALATTSPERSFPTLRGHPPEIALGESLDVPAFVYEPDTGVELGLPYAYGPLFAAAPLAYYLSARIVESETPYLAAGGVRRELPSTHEDLAAALGTLLRHCFTLDCATRACPAGLYDVDLRVHEVLTERLDPPWEAWYDADLATRTARYLEVPVSATLDRFEWPRTTDVTPAVENASVLPFLAADLSLVRSPPPTPSSPDGERPAVLDRFLRRADAEETAAAFTRSAGEPGPLRRPTQNVADDRDALVTPRSADSTSLAWVGPAFPMRASKPTVEAYRRRLDRTPSAELTIGVTVVCNDERMAQETADAYGFRDHLAFDVSQHRDLSMDELRGLLCEEHDFFHYVGHVDERGVECRDGFLDLRELSETGVDAFLLNACASYRQGMALVEAGGLGGVVTLADLPNELATRIGRDLARLLDAGFPLDAALDVVARGPFAGSAYTAIGDPRVQLCQSGTAVPMVADVTSVAKGTFEIQPRLYTTKTFDVGSMFNSHYHRSSTQYVGNGTIPATRLVTSELDEVLELGRTPLLVDNDLYWTDSISAKEIAELTGRQ